MRLIGIIAEYNPFHNGHAYQIRQLREACPDAGIIVVMSGAITQRGTIAIMDQWQRARLAVTPPAGCDLVFELPLLFACRSAQYFADGGVALLTRLGCTDIAFGAECGDLEQLQRAAATADTAAVQTILHDYLQAGASYAAALTAATARQAGLPPELLKEPNNILAIEYLRALRRQGSSLQPHLIQRQGRAYHDLELTPMASAAAIRSELMTGNPDWNQLASAVPPHVLNALQQIQALPDMTRLLPAIKLLLTRTDSTALQAIYGLHTREGLENRLRQTARTAATFEELVHAACSPRHTASHIRRLLIYLLLGLTAETAADQTACGPQYARLLAAGPHGKQLLHELKQLSSIPMITKLTHYLQQPCFYAPAARRTPLQESLRYDVLAAELAALTSTTPPVSEFQRSPIFL